MNYKVNKSTCEKYFIELDNGDNVTITIDETGLFQASGSLGSYSYNWYSTGKSFKEFLIRISNDYGYFLRTVCKGDYYYQDETKDRWKEIIINARRGNCEFGVELSKEKARELYNIIEDNIDFSTADSCVRDLYENYLFKKAYVEPWSIFNAIVSCSPDEIYFAKEILPIFADILKEELIGKIV